MKRDVFKVKVDDLKICCKVCDVESNRARNAWIKWVMDGGGLFVILTRYISVLRSHNNHINTTVTFKFRAKLMLLAM